jgi:hypothetical protein
MKANLILLRSAARQITSLTDVASWDAFAAHRTHFFGFDVVCCSGVTEYKNRAGTLQFLDSRGIDVGETPNYITLVLTMKLLSPRVIQLCNPKKYCTLGFAHPWQWQKFVKNVRIKLDRTEMGYNDVQTVNYWVNWGFGVIISSQMWVWESISPVANHSYMLSL